MLKALSPGDNCGLLFFRVWNTPNNGDKKQTKEETKMLASVLMIIGGYQVTKNVIVPAIQGIRDGIKEGHREAKLLREKARKEAA